MKTISINVFGFAFLAFAVLSSCGSDNKKEKSSISSSEVNNKGTETVKKESASNAPVSTIQFEEDVFDFGEIKQGDVVSHVFKFKNTGKIPLSIQDATAPCGCTVPSWPKEPIAPGQSGEIKVEFNSQGKEGVQSKKVTITANTEPSLNYVEIKTVVVKK